MLRIAICSDLHIGDQAREFDLRPGGAPSYAGQTGYLEYFRRCIDENAISADILVVSGDITDKAQPSQFDHAMNVIAQLADTLKVQRDCVFVIPGNHDLNWDVAELAIQKKEPFWQKFRFAPFINGLSSFDGTVTRASKLADPPHFFLANNALADMWCFNSAAYDLPETKPHHGRIREADRQELKSALEAAYGGAPKEKFRLFVTHHHPRPQPDLYKDWPDFSGMVNGESLMDLLTAYQFDVILHGHKHKAWCRSENVAGQNPIAIWCSGSFSLSLGPLYAGSVGNVWHLMELHGLSEAENAYGVVHSWAFAPGQGWLPSRPVHHAIDHVTPFGKVADRAAIKQLMRTEIKTALKSKSLISWEDVCAESSGLLKYQSGSVVWGILEELKTDLELRPHGDQDSLDKLYISRRKDAA